MGLSYIKWMFNRTEDCLLGEEIVLSGNLRITDAVI